MKINRGLMRTSLLSALAICLSPATAVGQPTTITSSVGFQALAPTTANTGNINTATTFTLGQWTALFGTGIFGGMPVQNFGNVPLDTRTGTGFSLVNSAFGHFASTSITSTSPAPGFNNVGLTGLWTPGTYCNVASGGCPVLSPLIRMPFSFPAQMGISFTQVGGPGTAISANATFAVTTPTEPVIGPSVATDSVVQPIARQMGLARSARCMSASAMRQRTRRA